MARKRGEISVFLSLVLVCVMSLLLGLVESARTAGARLYLEMAADSAMASVMSQYNRNLWDMYHLLFLETESDEAVEQSFASYLGFYFERENFYPMEIKEVNVTGRTGMVSQGGRALEQEILSYVTYCLPEVAADLAGIAEAAGDASKVGDFRSLFGVCRTAGKRTRKLENCRNQLESCLQDLEEVREALEDAVLAGSERRLCTQADRFGELVLKFEASVEAYEAEVQCVENDLAELKSQERPGLDDAVAEANLAQEVLAYEQVAETAKEQLKEYEAAEVILDESNGWVLEAVRKCQEGPEEGKENFEPDWGFIESVIDRIQIPVHSDMTVDREKVRALDRLEEVLQGDLLEFILPEGTEVSRKSVRLEKIPSDIYGKGSYVDKSTQSASVLEQFLINEYCFLSFDSFLKKCQRDLPPNGQQLIYEQEYLLCGTDSDRKNLKETVEKLLAVRGAMNLLFLLQSAEHRAAADSLAISVSGGIASVQFILSFFILTMWALGEAVWDVKKLINGESVAFWKNTSTWRLGLEELLALRFLEQPEGVEAEGNDYQDYMRVLFFLMDKEERNYRMMDLIQWNVQTIQEDFLVGDCVAKVEIQIKAEEQHVFLRKDQYVRAVETVGAY